MVGCLCFCFAWTGDDGLDLHGTPFGTCVGRTYADIFRFTFYWFLVFYLPLFVLCGFLAFLNIAFAPSTRAGGKTSRSSYFPLRTLRSRSRSRSDADASSGSGQRRTRTREGLGKRNSRSRTHSRRRSNLTDEASLERRPEHEAYPLTLRTFNSGASPTSATPLHPRNSLSSSAAGIYPPQNLSPRFPASPGFDGDGQDADREGVPSSMTHRTPPRTNPHRTRATFATLILFTYLASGLLGAVLSAAVLGYVLAGLYSAGNFHMST